MKKTLFILPFFAFIFAQKVEPFFALFCSYMKMAPRGVLKSHLWAKTSEKSVFYFPRKIEPFFFNVIYVIFTFLPKVNVWLFCLCVGNINVFILSFIEKKNLNFTTNVIGNPEITQQGSPSRPKIEPFFLTKKPFYPLKNIRSKKTILL